MNNRETAIRRLFGQFPQVKVEPATVAGYLEFTADIPEPVLSRAIRDLIGESDWLPSVAQIRKRAVMLTGANRDCAGSFRVMQQWLSGPESIDALDPFVRQIADIAEPAILNGDADGAYRHWEACWKSALSATVSSDLSTHPAITAGAAERLAIA